MKIRPMQLDDLEQVQAIDGLSFSMPWPASAYRYELSKNPLSILRVAEVTSPGSGTRLVGVIVVWIILDEAHIATIAVHPEYRGRRISQRLLAEGLQQAITRGALLATLEVRANNYIAQALYYRFQFEIVGRRPCYYQDNHEDALIMSVDFRKLTGGALGYREWIASGLLRINAKESWLPLANDDLI